MNAIRFRIEQTLGRLPRPPLRPALGVVAVAWTLLLGFDLLRGDLNRLTPDAFHPARRIVMLIALVPMLLRIVNPDRIDDDARAYRVFVRLTVVLGIASLALLLAGMLPFAYSASDGPDGLGSLIIGRLAGLVTLLALPVLAEGTSMLYRYRSRHSTPLLAVLFSLTVIAAVAVGQIIPVSVEAMADDRYVVLPLINLIGIVAFVRSIRSRWLINQRKRQKLWVLALSAAGITTSIILLALLHGTNTARALASFFPGLLALSLCVAVAMIVTQLCVFFNALLSIPTAEAIDRRNNEVASLVNLAQLLTRSFDPLELVDTSLSIAREVTGSAVAWMRLRDAATADAHIVHESTRHLADPAARAVMDAVESRERPSPSLWTSRRRRVSVATAIEVTDRSGPAEIVIRSAAATPLQLAGRTIGVLYVAKSRPHAFDSEDVTILEAVADQIALAIDQSRLIQESMQRERLEQEMVIARDAQQRLLPRQLPESPCFRIHAESVPASIVGGDYFDVVGFEDDSIGVIIADVSGKGASAALYMSMIKGIIQALNRACASPRELLSKINVALYGNIDRRRFATMTCARLAPVERRMSIARAGHCPTLLVRGGRAHYSRPDGLGLAIARPEVFDRMLDIDEVDFEPGDAAIFVSDGIPEATDPDGTELGYERLAVMAQRAVDHVNALVAETLDGSPDEVDTPEDVRPERDLEGGRREAAAGTDVEAAEAALDARSALAIRDAMFEEISTFTRGVPPSDDSTIVVVHWR